MDGFLLIDKPAGLTSHDVVDAVRRIAKTKRVGHAGTLDPFATGLLILGINRATKKLADIVGLDKEYIATAKLGATSTTDDPEGVISNVEYRMSKPPSIDDVTKIIDGFRGSYVQTAPAYSAKKVGGKKLYELARKGTMEGVELPKKEVKIHELEIISYEWPELKFRAVCSSGTYIRALARDIGEALGTGAYLTALRRTRIRDYTVDDSLSLDALDAERMARALIPL